MGLIGGLLSRLQSGEKPAATWSVVSTVAEPPSLLLAFAAHYLSIGASEVHLFLDDPGQPGIELLKAMPGVRLTICDAAYWKTSGKKRPPRQEGRQIHNANVAYSEARSDWLFFCDADEYLLPVQPVGKLLGQLPETVIQCRPHMSERMFGPGPQDSLFAGQIKRPIPTKVAALSEAFGPLAPFTTGGLLGHVIGKSFTRTGRSDIRIKIHMAVPKDPAVEMRMRKMKRLRPGPQLDGLWLVHYDGLTPLHWKLKLLRYAMEYRDLLNDGVEAPFAARPPARLRQIRHVYDRLDTQYDLSDLMPLLQPHDAAVDRLRAAGGLLDLPFDPVAAAMERGVIHGLDFSAAEFDAVLRQRKAAEVDRYGL